MKRLIRNPLPAAAAVLVAVALLLPLVAWYGYRSDLSNLEKMLYSKGSSLMETVLRESENALLADREISDLMADRLADHCRFTLDLSRRGNISSAVLDSLAGPAGLARLDLYSPSRALLVSSRPETSPEVLPEALLGEYSEFEPRVYQGMVSAANAGFTGESNTAAYFAVAMQGGNGRWAAAWVDGKKLTMLRRRLGLGLILDDLASVQGINYAVLQDSLGIIAASFQVVSLSRISTDPFFPISEGRIKGRYSTFENREVYEVTSRFVFGGEDFGYIRLGLSTDQMRVIAAGDRRRIALGIVALAVLLTVVAGLYLYGRRQFKMELDHLRLQGFSRSVLDGMGEAVIVLDDSGRVVQMNPACSKFCPECGGDESIGRAFEELNPQLSNTVADMSKESRITTETEIACPQHNHTVPSLVTVSRQRIAGRNYTTVILTDLTDRREKERLALRNQRFRTMAEVSAGMAHEIRNPLNAIAMNVQRLKLEFAPADGDREEYDRFVETIRGEVARLNRIVEQFLTFASFPHPVPEPVRIGELADETARFMAPDLESSSIEVLTGVEQSSELMLDPGQIRQVLTNLISNAAQAIGSGGRIEIKGKTDRSGFYILTVSDTGPGIDKNDLEKIFEPFYTTRSKGTGLGLAIAARIVAEHAGTIRAENNLDGGAVFVVSLPVPADGDEPRR